MNLHLVPSPMEEALEQLIREFRMKVEREKEPVKYPPPPEDDE